MKQQSNINLLRHGETKQGFGFFGNTDTPLTENGLKQMWTAINKNTHRWNRIITSPLQRCAQFAEALQDHYLIPLTRDERIKEIYFGDWEGCYVSEIAQKNTEALTRFWKNPVEFPPPNAELLIDFKKRVLSAWNDIVTHHKNQNILLITHGGVIRVILCHVLQHPIGRLLEFKVQHASMWLINVEYSANFHSFRLATKSPE